MRALFEENLSSQVIMGSNFKIPSEILKNSDDLSAYKRTKVTEMVYDGIYSTSLFLPNGKPGIFVRNDKVMVISVSEFNVKNNFCCICVEMLENKNLTFNADGLNFNIITQGIVGTLDGQELKNKTKVNKFCSKANSYVKRAASLLDDEVKLFKFVSSIHPTFKRG